MTQTARITPDLHALAKRCADVLTAHHAGRIQGGGEIRARCPVHRDQRRRTFSFNPNRGCWQCFAAGCGERGDIVGLARVLGLRQLRSRKNLKNLAATIDAQLWRGKAGATDREVLLALVTLAGRIGKPEITVSERQVAELAGIRRLTARRSLRRLRRARWLARLDVGRGREASKWRIQVPPRVVRKHPIKPSAGEYSSGSIAHDHDATRWAALGKNARLLLGVLNSEAIAIAELARRTGPHPATVRRFLRKAESCGVVIRLDDGRWTTGPNYPAGLDVVARACGTAGDAERTRHQHERERLAYRQVLAGPARGSSRRSWGQQSAATATTESLSTQ